MDEGWSTELCMSLQGFGILSKDKGSSTEQCISLQGLGILSMDEGSSTEVVESAFSCYRCGKPANLKHPNCVEDKLFDIAFCSPDCFKKPWGSPQSPCACCGKPTDLRCKDCVQLELPRTAFCSPDCFNTSYSSHKSVHVAPCACCGKPTGLRCVTCLKLKLPRTAFCSPDCVITSYSSHKSIHGAPCACCGKPTDLRCPTCMELNLPRTAFCSGDGFNTSFSSHKSVHAARCFFCGKLTDLRCPTCNESKLSYTAFWTNYARQSTGNSESTTAKDLELPIRDEEVVEIEQTMQKSQPSDNNVPSTSKRARSESSDSKCIHSISAVTGKTRKLSAPVWDHFTIKSENNEGKQTKAECNYCSQSISCHPKSNGNSAMNNHLSTCKKKGGVDDTTRGQQTLSFQSEGHGKKLLVNVLWTQEECRKSLVKMIIMDEMSFGMVEGLGFKHFCQVNIPKFVIPSCVTIARDCLKLYSEEKTKLKKILKNQRVSLTTDTWTSLQNLSYMCITVHWISNEWKLEKRIINFCQVSSHKGEIIGRVIEKCLVDWGIDSIFCVTIDNASSNDTAIGYLRRNTKTWGNTILEHEFLHIRCSAHILNLIASDGLKYIANSILRIRNAVKWVRSSTHRLETFRSCVRDANLNEKRLLCLDVTSCWKSTYLMLEMALIFMLAFEKLYDRESSYRTQSFGLDENGVELGPPMSSDWNEARMYLKFLEVFNDTTNKFSGSSYVTSNSFLNRVFSIQPKLLKYKADKDSDLRRMLSQMQEKFDKYWEMEKINPILYVSFVLDPRSNLKGLRFCLEKLNFSPLKVDSIVNKVRVALDQLHGWYSTKCTSSLIQNVGENSNDARMYDDDDMMDQFEKFEEEQNSLANMSEVDKYVEELRISNSDNFNILDWWKSNSSKYPILSLIARDVLAIPVSSVTLESTFSTGGRVLDTFRTSLSPSMVEALICTQDWLRMCMVAIDLREALSDLEKFEEIEKELLGEVTSHPSYIAD